MKNVKKMASAVNTCMGGICWVPSACRRKPRTTTTLVKAVTMMTIEGASARIVSMNRTWSAPTTSSGLLASLTPRLTLGMGIPSAAWSSAGMRNAARIAVPMT